MVFSYPNMPAARGWRYAGAVAAIALAALARMMLNPFLGSQLPFVTFLLAVLFAAWWGGAGPGILAAVLGGLAADYFFVAPEHTFAVKGAPQLLGLLFYFVIAAASVALIRAEQRARERSEREAAQRRSAEESEARQRRRFQQTLAGIGDAVISTDRTGQIEFLNAVAEALTGWSAEDAAGRPLASVFRIVDADTGAPIESPVAGVLRRGATVGLGNHALLIRKDGSRIPIDDSAAPIRDETGAVTGAVLVFRDITRRDKAERERDAALAETRSILESIGDAFIAMDAEFRLMYVNAEAERVLGRKRDEMLGRTLWLLFPGAAGTSVEQEYRRCIQDRVAVELQYLYAPWSRWFEIRAYPRTDAGITLYFRDITGRRRVEEQVAALNRDLARRIREFETLLEVIPIGIGVAAEPDCRLVRPNPALERMLAAGPAPCRLLVDGAEDPNLLPMQTAAREGREIRDVQVEAAFADGSVRTLLAYAAPLFDEQHKTRGAIGAFVDFTDQKRIMAELHEASQRLRFHFENTPLGVVEWNPDFKIVAWNREAERIFGWDAIEVLGCRIDSFRLVHEDDLPGVRALMEEMIAGRRSRNVNANRNYRKDGSLIECEWYNSVLLDAAGKLKSVLSVVVDVTERNRAEQVLRESESKLRTLVEAASQGILAVNPEARIVLVNARTEEMFGYSREELLGQPLELVVPERFRSAHDREVAEYMVHPRTRPMGAGLRLFGRRKDGSEFPVEISLSHVEQQGTRITLALVTDITDRERLEQQVRQTQKLESLGVLAGGVAHDFNNLLTGIMGNASLALEAAPAWDPNRGTLEAIIRACESAAHLTRQLLAYAGKGQFAAGPVDLSAVAADLAGLLRRSISKLVRIELNLASGLPAVEADTGQMNQLVMNLILNAAEAIGDDSEGTVQVRTGMQELHAGSEWTGYDGRPLAPGTYVCLEVTDDGCGMDAQTQARIFDPFFTTKFMGRGLGLAAVHGILRSHRGGIRVESEPGRGSRFTVLLPAARTAAEPRSVAAAAAPARRTGTVLVVDDEEIVRSTAKSMLERHGYEVVLAANGVEAVEAVRREPAIAAVLLDWTMPVMGGEQAAEQILSLRPEMPVVVTTGFSYSEAVERFAGIGVASFVQKPFTAASLARELDSALHTRR